MRKNLYLIGMMGAGKSALGLRLAKQTYRRFVDVDAVVAETAGRSVEEIFRREGEAGFRRREAAALKKISRRRGQIVACGGGIVESSENITLLRKSGIVVWLKRDLARSLAHPRVARRPLLRRDPDAIFKLMEKREPLYKKACHFVVYNDGDFRATLKELRRILA